ncbi:hypothetical protein [Bacillus rubiinfantis]|nr:hypothetical protein [Bacillus rubiinfantis]
MCSCQSHSKRMSPVGLYHGRQVAASAQKAAAKAAAHNALVQKRKAKR